MAGVPLSERGEFTMGAGVLVTAVLQQAQTTLPSIGVHLKGWEGNLPKLQQVMGCSRWTAWDGSAKVIQGNVVGGLAVGLGRWGGYAYASAYFCISLPSSQKYFCF